MLQDNDGQVSSISESTRQNKIHAFAVTDDVWGNCGGNDDPFAFWFTVCFSRCFVFGFKWCIIVLISIF